MKIDPKSVPLSPARRAGDLLFLSGQVAFDETGKLVGADVAAQTDRVLTNIENVLLGHGATLADVVNASVWLTDPEDFSAFNSAYGARFPGTFPARSTVISELLAGALVEIAVIAYLGG